MKKFKKVLMESAKPSDGVASLINDQITAEFNASLIYLEASAFFHSIGLDGFSYWMEKHSLEEHSHGMKFFSFMKSLGIVPNIYGIDAPGQFLFEDAISAMSAILAHENIVTERIKTILVEARNNGDYAIEKFIVDFLSEQIEEEEKIEKIIALLENAGDDKAAILLIDKELRN